MSTIVTRLGKGNALTWQEADANFTNLNLDKVEESELASSTGSSMVGYLPDGTGAVTTTIQDKLRESVSVKDFGAVGDGVTDDYSAFVSALSSGAKSIIVPLGQYKLSSGITVPSGVTLIGVSVLVGKTGYSGVQGSVLQFNASVAICVTLSNANLTTGNIKNIAVIRTGTAPAGSIGILVDRGSNIQLENVLSRNHANCYKFYAQTTAGISGHMLNCYGDQFTENCFYVDSWPELYVTGGRFGSGDDPANPNAFIYITGTSASSGGIGPNTLNFNQCHFNGNNTVGPAYWLQFDGVGTPSGNQVEYIFNACHVESIRTAVIKTTSTAPYLNRVFIGGGSVLNVTQATLFAIDASSSISQFEMNGVKTYCGSLNLTATNSVTTMMFIGGEIIVSSGAPTFTGKAGVANTLQMIGTSVLGGTLTFTGTWKSCYVRVGSNTGLSTTGIETFDGSSLIDIEVKAARYRNINGIIDTIGSSGSSAVGYTLNAQTSRGSVGTPTISQSNDMPYRVQGYLYDGSAYQRAGILRLQNGGGAPAAGSTPAQWIFSTTPVGSTSPTDSIAIDPSGNLYPSTDNAVVCGKSGARWSAVWATTGTIQTSDYRTKDNIENASLGLGFIKSLRPVSYTWKVGGNEVVRQIYRDADGNEVDGNTEGAIASEIITKEIKGTRTHWGLIAQEVKQVVDASGVDFAGWVLTDKNDPDSQQALRYDQFIAPLIKAVQEQQVQIERQDAVIYAMQSQLELLITGNQRCLKKT